MEENEIYNKLIENYNNLSEVEKQCVLIYKSKLFYHINSISEINDFINISSLEILDNIENKEEFISRYEKYKEEVFKPQNIFLRYSIFNKIDFDNICCFIDSLKSVYKTIDNAKFKLTLPDELTVYRGCSYNQDNDYEISKSNLISTTIDPEQTANFLFTKKENRNKLYVIKLEKGTPVLITPYSILSVYDSEVDYLNNSEIKQTKIINSSNKGQQEIILFKDSLDFKLASSKICEEGNLEVETFSSKIKHQSPSESIKKRV